MIAICTVVLFSFGSALNKDKNQEPIQNTSYADNNETQKAVQIIVNINNATQADLKILPGIGNVCAQNIVEYRSENGKFQNKEDIMKIKGISKKRFTAIKDLITL